MGTRSKFKRVDYLQRRAARGKDPMPRKLRKFLRWFNISQIVALRMFGAEPLRWAVRNGYIKAVPKTAA